MKLVAFSVKKYRSISNAYNLPLANYSVIVGPNNEGKSNILKGMVVALNLLTSNRGLRHTRLLGYTHRRLLLERFDYQWERDFPINLQKDNENGLSEFTCEFELDNSELIEFRREIGINLNTNIKVKIFIGKEGYKVDFLMKGKGKASLNKKRKEIVEFIKKRIMIQYIPAVRTSELAIAIVEEILEKEMSVLEKNPEFIELIEKISKLQQPIIKEISKGIRQSISSFIPDVKNITIKNKENVGRLISSSCKIFIDDGIETDLELKGDGVISLTAISILQHSIQQGALEKGLILLLEEPESHLHPRAIHNLKKVLYDISKNSQVILTTHSPIVVERTDIHQNILVQNGKAVKAKNISEIRNSLGIEMADNLSSAYLVLLVEGEEDKIILRSWLEQKSQKIRQAIHSNVFQIDDLGGATNIGYKAGLYKSCLCNVFAFLDYDECGRKSVKEAIDKGVLLASEYTLSSCHGMTNSEIEDLIQIESYRQLIIDDYGVDLKHKKFKNSKRQWSSRVKDVFLDCGKLWDDTVEMNIKWKVNNKAAKEGVNSLNPAKTNVIDSLVKSLETILDRRIDR